jgi:hypothetical protein
MVNERVSVIKVDGVDPNLGRLFARARPGEIVPQPGVVLHKIGNGRFSAARMLEGGGRVVVVMEIVDGVLKPMAN